jgi:putative transcriptional regulator
MKHTKKPSRGVATLMESIAELSDYKARGLADEQKHEEIRRKGGRVVTRHFAPEPGEYSRAAVKTLREKLGMSQAAFAALVGVSTILVQSWEQGVRTPAPLARRLLDVISDDPAAFVARLSGKPSAASARRKAG